MTMMTMTNPPMRVGSYAGKSLAARAQPKRDGGPVKDARDGGKIKGVGGPTDDANLIAASNGEVMMPVDTVAALGDGDHATGVQRLQDIINETHTPVATTKGLANGGSVWNTDSQGRLLGNWNHDSEGHLIGTWNQDSRGHLTTDPDVRQDLIDHGDHGAQASNPTAAPTPSLYDQASAELTRGRTGPGAITGNLKVGVEADPQSESRLPTPVLDSYANGGAIAKAKKMAAAYYANGGEVKGKPVISMARKATRAPEPAPPVVANDNPPDSSYDWPEYRGPRPKDILNAPPNPIDDRPRGYYADGGLIGNAEQALSGRQKKLDDAEYEAVNGKPRPPPTTPTGDSTATPPPEPSKKKGLFGWGILGLADGGEVNIMNTSRSLMARAKKMVNGGATGDMTDDQWNKFVKSQQAQPEAYNAESSTVGAPMAPVHPASVGTSVEPPEPVAQRLTNFTRPVDPASYPPAPAPAAPVALEPQQRALIDAAGTPAQRPVKNSFSNADIGDVYMRDTQQGRYAAEAPPAAAPAAAPNMAPGGLYVAPDAATISNRTAAATAPGGPVANAVPVAAAQPTAAPVAVAPVAAPTAPAAPAAEAPSGEMSYGDQMSSVAGLIGRGLAQVGKTLVSAPGSYSPFAAADPTAPPAAPAAAPAPAGPALASRAVDSKQGSGDRGIGPAPASPASMAQPAGYGNEGRGRGQPNVAPPDNTNYGPDDKFAFRDRLAKPGRVGETLTKDYGVGGPQIVATADKTGKFNSFSQGPAGTGVAGNPGGMTTEQANAYYGAQNRALTASLIQQSVNRARGLPNDYVGQAQAVENAGEGAQRAGLAAQAEQQRLTQANALNPLAVRAAQQGVAKSDIELQHQALTTNMLQKLGDPSLNDVQRRGIEQSYLVSLGKDPQNYKVEHSNGPPVMDGLGQLHPGAQYVHIIDSKTGKVETMSNAEAPGKRKPLPPASAVAWLKDNDTPLNRLEMERHYELDRGMAATLIGRK